MTTPVPIQIVFWGLMLPGAIGWGIMGKHLAEQLKRREANKEYEERFGNGV